MGGLEKIIETIAKEAEAEAREITDAAQKKAADILEQCKKDKEKTAEEFKRRTQEECMRLSGMIEAAAEADARQAVLAAKRSAINEIIEYVKSEVKNLPEREYFDLLLKLAQNNRENSDGVMYLSEKDIKRLPADFSEKVNEGLKEGSIKISEEPCSIDAGFIIKYGKIDINCSIDSIFEDKQNKLADIINASL